ncbi:MAG: hypothetical protein EP301_03620 [Gammaproteobacteria bacterium]|jgi:N-glycosylase/DNA lyase|nr:MAG: hypothetical protein EP301_03620 [Gammaproteobacteria bacterium]
MPVEEIVLSLPETAERSEPSRKSEVTPAGKGDELVRSYQQLLSESLMFAWTARSRARRVEKFETARKSLVKQLAREATAAIPSRSARLEASTQVYRTVEQLLNTSAAAQRRLDHQKRRLIRLASLLGVVWVATVCCLLILGSG